MSTGPFAQLALLLLIASVAGAIAVRLRQPVLIAYILVGVIVGPSGLHLVASHDQLALLAEIGVAVLLFLVGVRLDLQHVRHVGPVALATGLGQLGFTIVIGFALTLGLGHAPMEALYVAVALTFSSTIIIVKLLSDKRELDSLHGRIAVGFLIVQDIAVVLAMMAMSALGSSADAGAGTVLLSLVMRISAAVVLIAVLMRWVLPALVASMARSQELLLVFAVAWGTALAALGEWAGFSKEAGAFLAGFSLASTHYRDAMSARLVGIRDFLLLFFFVELGAKLNFGELGGQLFDAGVLSLFVLVGNPLIVLAIMGYMGYRSRTGLLAGLTVAQISEFSIVFVAMGITLGHVGQQALALTTLVGMITITLSTYMILYSEALYRHIAPWIRPFERRDPHRERAVDTTGHADVNTPEVIVFGLGRYGRTLIERLAASGMAVLGVDFDPEAVRSMRRAHVPARFGDGEDPEFLATLPLEQARWVVLTFPSSESAAATLDALRHTPFRGTIAAVARDEEQAALLKRHRIPVLMTPFADAADHAAQVIASGRGTSGENAPIHRSDNREHRP